MPKIMNWVYNSKRGYNRVIFYQEYARFNGPGRVYSKGSKG
ncbi:hypothetical protein [Mongoliitalea lutea]|nr:hypothetical protein [Mongoliitalea lutea]